MRRFLSHGTHARSSPHTAACGLVRGYPSVASPRHRDGRALSVSKRRHLGNPIQATKSRSMGSARGSMDPNPSRSSRRYRTTRRISERCDTSVRHEKTVIHHDTVLCKKLPMLIPESDMLVMRLLPSNVVRNSGSVPIRTSESSILFTPANEFRKMNVRLEPFAGTHLQFLNKLRQSYRCGQCNQQMHMIRHTANSN